MRRRCALGLLGGGLLGGGLLPGCSRERGDAIEHALLRIGGGWVGSAPSRGHRLRVAAPGFEAATGAQARRADALVIGGGIAGLAAARALRQAGIEDIALLELEDVAGGNSRGHSIAGLPCPLGAHYLPLPGEQAPEVAQWLHEIGLLRTEGGRSVADERHLCHAPQERLFFEGSWHDGLLPPADPGSATLTQYRAFAAEVEQAQRALGFALPTSRAPWGAGHAALDAQTFAQWLDARGLTDARLRWFLDYSCRDDFGAAADTVSAWAGLHYFASRHGFHAPGDASAERDAVLTWPEGNAHLVRHLAAPLGERLATGRLVRRIEQGRHGVRVLAERIEPAHRPASSSSAAATPTPAIEVWNAGVAVLALPLRIAARALEAPPPALVAAAGAARQAPWLVANLLLDAPPLDRLTGAPAAWDNVRYGSSLLGYVDAGHQRLDPRPQPTVFTAYAALVQAERASLDSADWRPWARRMLQELALLHPDLPERVQQIALARWGHAMAIPAPGLRSLAAPGGALAALAAPGPTARLHFAHADLSGYSVFEEAFVHGDRAGRAAATRLRRGVR